MLGNEGTRPNIFQCPSCKNDSKEEYAFCSHCGFPLKGTEEEMSTFQAGRTDLTAQYNLLLRRIRYASNTMYFLAGICATAGLGLYFIYDELEKPEVVLLVFLVLAALYGGLAFWCHEQPLPAIISGLV